MNGSQLDLFAHVASAYADAPNATLDNAALYAQIAQRAGVTEEAMDATVAIGADGEKRSPIKRTIRWHQQSLKALGVIEHVEGARGLWRLSESAGERLHKAANGVKLVAFSTHLGVAIWSRSADVFGGLNEPVALCISSPPFPLKRLRAYGNPNEMHYVDFICQALEPIVRNLIRGGNILLNVSNDIFGTRSPARSLYVERLVLALHERLGLALMDRVPWVNLSKPPGPTWWACVQRVQLTTAYEPIFWFTNDPTCVRSDNRRVLVPHTARHQRLMHAGGEQRTATYGDGVYKVHPGAYSNPTEGAIPRNVFQRGHTCPDTRTYRQQAAALGLPLHGAMQPTAIADFFIRFLSQPDDLVVDPFGGTIRTGLAAERLGRRWLVTEWIVEYLRGAAELFRHFDGFVMHPALASMNPIDDERCEVIN
jgi:DNA modification methylase